MARYDTALTTFSPDGNLYQVKYAFEAVEKGKAVVGVRCKDKTVILGVENPVSEKLQIANKNSADKKISLLDNHIICAHAGLSADARVLLDRARVECQSHRLTVEDKISVSSISKWLSELQQKYTQTGGVRPFGVSVVVGGEGRLFKTEPTGSFLEYKAVSSGWKSEKTSEYLEKNFKEGLSEDEGIKLVVETLMEVVEDAEGKEIEIWVMRGETKEEVSEAKISDFREEILKQREEERIRRENEARK